MWRELRSGGLVTAVGVACVVAACGESPTPPRPADGTTLGPRAGTGGASAAAGSVGVGGIRIELPPADDGPTQALDCAVPAPPQSLTRWSLIDIDGALDATFGPGTTLASQLGYAESPFERDLSSDFAYQLYQVAQARVAAAVPRHDLVVCDADDDAGEDCVQSFLRDYGKKLYRRPLTRDQVSAYVAQFQSASRDTTPAGAAKTALVSMVLSPYFVFRVELSQGADPRLTPYEVATRLARFATRRPPDAVLLAAAEDNALQNAPQLDAQLQRLWATDAGRDARALLHLEWFRLQGPNWRKDLDPDLHADMDAQARAFIADVLDKQGGTLELLLTSAQQPLNARLAAHLGLEKPAGSGFQTVDLDGNLFAGLLTTGAFLTQYPRPTLRGMHISDALLCSPVPPPPPNIAPLAEGATPRERISNSLSGNPTCTGCHDIVDSIGFALEAFDDLGRPSGNDTSGALRLPGGSTALKGPYDLGKTLASAGSVQACVARRYLEYALDREVTPGTYARVVAPQPTAEERWLSCLTTYLATRGATLTGALQMLGTSSLVSQPTMFVRQFEALDTSPDPLEHALQETLQFRGVFDTAGAPLVESYVHALEGAQGRDQQPTGAAGASGDASGGANGTAGAP